MCKLLIYNYLKLKVAENYQQYINKKRQTLVAE